MPRPRPVFLLTDFGPEGYYQGVLRGVLAAAAPGAPIHDLSHGIRPGAVREASYVLAASLPYLPSDAVVVAVVDPGVGTARRILALRLEDRSLLAPDNGLLTPFLSSSVAALHRVDRDDLCLPNPSRTFHGRDVFAPVAARLAVGLREEELGPSVSDPQRFEVAEPRAEVAALRGEVVYVDPFGNLVSNIRRDALELWLDDRRAAVQVAGVAIGAIAGTFGDVASGALVAYFGSTGHLEIAVRDGRADATLAAGVGTAVVVSA